MFVPKTFIDVDFHKQPLVLSNIGVMHVLALSADTETLDHVARIFSDQITDIAIFCGVSEFIHSGRTVTKGVFIVDYDLLQSVFPNPLQFIAQMPPDAEFIFVGSHGFAQWHGQLRAAGAIILHKPNVAGEFGIALRRIAAARSEKGKTA